MAWLEWRDEYRTGIAGVDYEHEQLIRQINATLELIRKQADRALVIDGLGDIYGSIAAHFALEEQMMQRHSYAHYREHRADHDRLLDEIGDIADEYEHTARLDEAAFMQKLADWFHVHFKTHDARLHAMANMRQHDAVSQSTLSGMIQHARRKFLDRR